MPKATKRGIHTRPNRGQSVEWLTPPELIYALGSFDVDPCAHPLQVEAFRKRSRDVAPCLQTWNHFQRVIGPDEDGLTADWGSGRAFLNPPYGVKNSAVWMNRLADHGRGTALVASRTEVESWWVPHVFKAATAVLYLAGRLHYYSPDGNRAKGNAGHGSALVAYGREDAGLLLLSGLEGTFHWLGHE